MAKYVVKELPKEMTDGKKVLFPKMRTYTQHDFETVLKHMKTYGGSFSEGTMRGVLDALVETMKAWMPMGHSIKIDGLGTFSLSLGFDDDSEGSKYRHVSIKGINFKPDAELLAEMNRENTFEKAETEVQTPRRSQMSRDERLAKAKSIIESNGYMTLTDYALATDQSRTKASRDLSELTADPGSGIGTRGSHSHKVWVKK